VDHRFLKACRREPVDRTPVWFMRQAGRFLPEYRRLREEHDLDAILGSPELAAEVTMQPVRRFEVDAALLFSDITLPLRPLGIPVELINGERGQVSRPLTSPADIDRLRVYEPREELGDVLETIRVVRRELGGHRPLLGVAAAPFTLACCALEGTPRELVGARSLMYGEPEAWHRLCETLATVIGEFLRAQVEAGAQVLHIFDTWVGGLGPEDYRRFVLPHTRAVFDALADLDVPTIHFGLGTSALLELMTEAGGDVIGIDWRIPLDEAWDRVGHDRGIQGNLDPTVLVGSADRLLDAAAEVLDRAAGRPGHVFSLGHGLLPSTPVDRVQTLVRYVHRHTAANLR
jgi:uroporphyrinogen decarboxylase